MKMQAVIANNLRNGFVIFLGADGEWRDRLADAAIAAAGEPAAALLARAQADAGANRIVDPYLIDVDTGSGAPVPVSFREKVRSLGPSNRPDLGKQAGE